MPSLDERRDAAARLRNIAGAPEWATTACCIAECLGEHDYPLWDDSKPLFNRLADLIEPEQERTCRIVAWYEARSREEIGRERVKLSCGHIAERHSKFCSQCGAKVTGGATCGN